MIVQPTPTNPRTRRSRARRIAGLVVPPALLALVVVAGFAGPRPQAAAVPMAPPPAAGVAGPSLAPGEHGTVPGAGSIPAMFGDLVARGPEDVLDDTDALAPSDAIALEGYLGMDATESTCGDAPGAPYGAWCDRRGIIAVASWIGTGSAPFPAHVRVHIPVGVRLPAAIERAAAGDEPDPMPVLVVGRRAVVPAACLGWGPAICQDDVVIDRVAWAGGVRVGLTPLVDDRLQRDRRPNPFMTSLDLADLPLLAALVWPEDVWRLDADAGVVAQAGTPGEPVWYLRVLDGARGPGMERRVRWMLLAEPDLRLLASGRPGGATFTAALDRG